MDSTNTRMIKHIVIAEKDRTVYFVCGGTYGKMYDHPHEPSTRHEECERCLPKSTICVDCADGRRILRIGMKP